jgi:Uri superfamily endonuclease
VTIPAFAASGGVYVLLLKLERPTALTVGRLGRFKFPAGWYTYVGSAHGPGGLAGRLSHHLRPAPRPHWHIDYLRAAAAVVEVWWNVGPAELEHTWAKALLAWPGAALIVPRFGASDCRCLAHLVQFTAAPDCSAVLRQTGSPLSCSVFAP